MKYELNIYSIWEYGQRKDANGNPHQEDCTYPLPNDIKNTDRTFILCDGMGGHDAGEVASATVCGAMAESIRNDGHDADGVFTDNDLQNAISDAFNALDCKDNGAVKKMGTTMTFLKFHKDGVTIAHIGDSRVYHIRPGKTGQDTQILFQTEDHSLINDLIKVGELTREEARYSSQKNVITRAMQPHLDRKPQADIYHTADIKNGDYFYMCSDGMLEQSDMEDGTTLCNIFSEEGGSDEQKVNILRDVTEDNHDNHTAIIIRVDKVEGDIPKAEAETSNAKSKRMAIIENDDHTDRAKKPKNKINAKGLIGRFFVAAIIVAICIMGYNYFICKYSKTTETNTEISIDESQPSAKESYTPKIIRNQAQENKVPTNQKKELSTTPKSIANSEVIEEESKSVDNESPAVKDNLEHTTADIPINNGESESETTEDEKHKQ